MCDSYSSMEDMGFSREDSVWKAETRPSVCASCRMALVMVVAVLPGAVVFLLWGYWNLSTPLYLLGKAAFESWPRDVQWAHVLSEGLSDGYVMLLPEILVWSLQPKGLLDRKARWWNVLFAFFPILYLSVLQALEVYDPECLRVHLPLNVLWFSSVLLNAVMFCVDAAVTRRELASLAAAFIFALVPPVVTANLIFILLFPTYISSNCSFLHKGFVVGIVVPSSFFFSQFCSRQACLVIMGPNRHPRRVARLLTFSVILESFARRILLCGVEDLRLIFLSSLVLGLGDTIAQISVDLRDGIVYSMMTCGTSDYRLFEHPGRRRLRADALLLHYMSEHLAIVCLSGFAVLVQVINLKRPISDVLWSVEALALQMAVRLFFDFIVFSTESQVGCIARALFRLSRWHGIAVFEVWRKCRRELLFFSMHMALTAAVYGQYFFKSFFEKSLAMDWQGHVHLGLTE